jgi:uncharacterized protein (DUF2141 family)
MPPSAEVEVRLALRNARGLVHLCLTARPDAFPASCKTDPAGIRKTVPAAQSLTVQLAGVKPGTYGLSLIHDENGNGKLDKFGPVPTEGFGFSRNPSIGFGPPAFKAVSFAVSTGRSNQDVRVRYLL